MRRDNASWPGVMVVVLLGAAAFALVECQAGQCATSCHTRYGATYEPRYQPSTKYTWERCDCVGPDGDVKAVPSGTP